MNARWMKWLLLAQVCVVWLAGCGGGESGGSDASASQALVSLAVTPKTASMAKGTAEQFTAIGIYSDGTSRDITSSVTWRSSDDAVVTIGSTGTAIAANPGTARVSAVAGFFSATANATVTTAVLQSIAITPSAPAIPVGVTQQLTAIGTFSDGSSQDMSSSVTWSSPDLTVASVTAGGLLTAVASGSVRIGASAGSVSAGADVTVTPAVLQTIMLSPDSPSVPAGLTRQFTAMGTYSDGTSHDITTQVTWQSGSTDVAAVDAGGLATAMAAGVSELTASLANVSGATTINVSAAELQRISLTPATSNVPAGLTQQFTAMGAYSDGSSYDITSAVNWTSDNLTSAIVDGHGLATGMLPGTARIGAAVGTLSASATVTVSSAVLQSVTVLPVAPSVAAGLSQQFTAMGAYSDGSSQDLTSQVSWRSASSTVAVIEANGLATGAAPGTTQMTAALGNVSGAATLHVSEAVLQGIWLAPAMADVPAGLTQEFTAMGAYSDGSSQDISSMVTWSTDNVSVAMVDAAGLATGTREGVTQITVTAGSRSASAPLTVTSATLQAIVVSPGALALPAGLTQPLTATGTYSDGATRDITGSVSWTSANTGTATVTDTGVATAVAVGTTSVTAVARGVSGAAEVTVTPAVLQSISVSPENTLLAVGLAQQFEAEGHYSDGSEHDITDTVTWVSSDNTFATVDSSGRAVAVAEGAAQISATHGDLSGAATLTVTAATLQSLTVSPASATISVLGTYQFSATGNFSDGTTKDLTHSVRWRSSNNLIARVNERGLATGFAPGTTSIYAFYGTVRSSATLTVGSD